MLERKKEVASQNFLFGQGYIYLEVKNRESLPQNDNVWSASLQCLSIGIDCL
jgi:hypothetical protein